MSCLIRFRYGSGAISLLNELLKLDWRKRVNAIDALQHPYFRNSPLPAKPGDLPSFEESHELDRRKFRSQKAAPPPAPKGGTVGMGPNAGWGGEAGGSGNPAFGNAESYGGYRSHANGSRYPYSGGNRNGGQPDDRRPAWRPDTRLPPRPPVVAGEHHHHHHHPHDSGRPDGREGYRSRSHDMDRGAPPQRNRPPVGPNVDTYIPSYGSDGGRGTREERPREDRPREDRPRDERPRDDRRRRDDRDRDRLDYDERGRTTRTRSRSRSPTRDRDRERVRDREPLDRDGDKDRDAYRR